MKLMNLYCITKYLPEDVVRHVLSFDDRIVIRKGNLHIIHKINKELYKDAYDVLLKKSLVTESRTTHYNGEKQTWCTVRLWNYKKPYLNPYISYIFKNNELTFRLNIWGNGGLYREFVFTMP
jgi:hypothetical protein